MKGLILAAGAGKRLAPLSLSLPKAILPVSGVPMIFYGLNVFLKAGVRDIGVVVWRKDEFVLAESLENFLKEQFQITYIRQKERLGTADALAQAEAFVGSETFCLTYCDHISVLDLRPHLTDHQTRKPAATILVQRGKPEELSCQITHELDRVTKIVEKPSPPLSPLGSAGMMILEPAIFSVLNRVKPGVGGESHVADGLQLLIDQGKPVHWQEINTWRVNANSFPDIRRAENHLAEGAATSR